MVVPVEFAPLYDLEDDRHDAVLFCSLPDFGTALGQLELLVVDLHLLHRLFFFILRVKNFIEYALVFFK
jgi:hypothetical protein